MTLTEIRRLLLEKNIRLTKSLGQNFLHDKNQLNRIVDAAGLRRCDKVIEIGPGLGQLTELLLAKAGKVLAIEKDARLVQLLKERFNVPSCTGSDEFLGLTTLATDKSKPLPERSAARLVLIHADALELFRTHQCDLHSWKLVSNMPFSVASAILVELAQLKAGPSRLVVTVQFEVAQRLRARPATPQYGALTLLVGLSYFPTAMFKIPATSFFPIPKVDSCCIVLERRIPPLLTSAAQVVFIKLVKRAFSQRRKMMYKLLRQDFPEEKLTQAFEKAGLDRTVRAEEVSLGQFVQLAQAL